VALGEDHIRILEFLAEHRVCVLPQLPVLLGCSPRTASGRLRALLELGLAARERVFEGHPAACWITPRGLAWLESGLPAPHLDLKGYRHDVGVAWLWLAAQNGAFGRLDRVVSERAMRSEDRRPGEPWVGDLHSSDSARPRHGIGVAAAGPRGGLALHYPDLLLATATGHRVAVELELTGKGPRRLDRIMLGYAADPQIDGALYLCPGRSMGLRVQAAARRAGISDRVQVQLLAPGSPAGAPDPGRLQGRSMGRRLARAASRRSAVGPASRETVAER
jgi:hypothetical protein